jgi:O-antigen ligase
MTTFAPENSSIPAVSPDPPYDDEKPRVLGALIFCSLVLGHRILERQGMSSYELDLALCIGASVIGFIWPIGAIVGVLGSTMIGEATAPLGASLSLWLRTALALRLAFDISIRRIPLSRITSGTYRYWLPFAAVVLLAYLVSGSSAGTAFIVKFALTAVFVAGCAAYVQGLNSLLTLQTGLVATGLVSAVWGILHVVGGGWRGGGLEVSPNYGAMYMCTAYLLALGLPAGRGPLRVLHVAAVVGIPLGIIVSGSRGGTLVMLFGTAAYLLLFRRSAGRFLRVAGFSILVGAIALTLLPEFVKNSRFLQTFAGLLRGSTVDPQTGRELDRLPLWRDSIRLWLSHPILGVGPQSWFGARIIIEPTAKTEAPHIYVAQILAELGTLGGLAYLYFLLRSFRAAARRLRRELQPWSELLTSWTVAGLALAVSVFSGNAYSPFLYAVIVIATSAGMMLPDSTPDIESQPSADQPVNDAVNSGLLPRKTS